MRTEHYRIYVTHVGKKSACASNIPPFKGTETLQNLGGLEIFQLETPYLHAVEMAMNNFCAVS